jgi:segregation and condensation protein A
MRAPDHDGSAARKLDPPPGLADAARPAAGEGALAERSGPDFDGQYRVKLESFEGPLDLLLHLIQQHELDILDIPVSFITAKYLEYLQLMQVLSIEIASEYLVMAATLVHIKSKMLLPAPPPGQDDGMPLEEEEDPRAELVRRLLEYQKYKAAAAELAERGTLGRDVFPRGVEEEAAPGPAAFARVEVFGLLEAFEKILKKAKIKIDHEVVFDRISITDRIIELTEKLQGRRAVRFEWLFLSAGGPQTRFDLVITFLAMLEMARMRLLRVYQTGPLAPIYMGLVEEVGELSEEDQALADQEATTVLAEPDPEPTREPEPAPDQAEPAPEPGAPEVVPVAQEAAIDVPDGVTDSPEVVIDSPQAVIEDPESAIETPESVVETPESVVEPPASVVEAPESVGDGAAEDTPSVPPGEVSDDG